MRRFLVSLLFLLLLVALAFFVWPTRWRYDHITVDGDNYLVRVDRVTGHADILVPEQGWTPSEQPWDQEPAPQDDRHTSNPGS
jgi:hypothetical protein